MSDFVDLESQTHKTIIQRQDDVLDKMSDQLDVVGGMARGIHTELGHQNRELIGLGEDVTQTVSHTKLLNKKLDRLLHDDSDKRKLWCIGILFVLAMILFIVVLTTTGR